MPKVIKLLTESIENGVYVQKYVDYTEEEYNKILKQVGGTMLEDMLKSVNLTEEIKVIDKRVYAVIPQLGQKRELNGCDVRARNKQEISNLEKYKQMLTKDLEKINTMLIDCKKLDNELSLAGYCLKDVDLYKKVDGIVIKGEDGKPVVIGKTHEETCTHKEG